MTATLPVGASEAVEVRDAATVLLLRDGDDGLEVAMLRRRLDSGFVPGAYVFPGGALDEGDRSPGWAARSAGLDDASASARLALPAGGLAYWVAAVRECFEEAGVLVARHADGRPLIVEGTDAAARFGRHRAGVDEGRVELLDVFAAEDLHLPAGELHYFARWITPEPAPRRYDTRFFVGRAPAGHSLRADGREAVAALWIRPADALARCRAGAFELIRPTEHSLEVLADFADTDAALAAAATARLGMEPPA